MAIISFFCLLTACWRQSWLDHLHPVAAHICRCLVHKTTSLSWILHILVGLVARSLCSSYLALVQRCSWEEILSVQQEECLPCAFLLLGFLQHSWRHCFQDGVLRTVAADKTNPKPALLCAAPSMQVTMSCQKSPAVSQPFLDELVHLS